MSTDGVLVQNSPSAYVDRSVLIQIATAAVVRWELST